MRSTAAVWATRVEAWRASGKTVDEFATEQSIKPASLRWWSSQLRRQATAGVAASVPMARVRRASEMRSERPAIVIELDGGRIEVREGFDRALLREVMGALGK